MMLLSPELEAMLTPIEGRRPAPESTIEALMYVLRGGLPALEHPATPGRLRQCDVDAMRAIGGRLLNMNALSKGARADWSEAHVASLFARWKAIA